MSGAPVAEDAVADAFAQTLEAAAFAFAEPTSAPPDFAGELLEARLAWQGAGASEVRLVVERRFAAALAAALVGEDEPDHDRAADALGELLNMAAAALAHEAARGAESALGVPSVRALSPAAWSAARAVAPCAVSLLEEQGNRIDVTVTPTVTPAEAGGRP